jgi:hypothetical protein
MTMQGEVDELIGALSAHSEEGLRLMITDILQEHPVPETPRPEPVCHHIVEDVEIVRHPDYWTTSCGKPWNATGEFDTWTRSELRVTCKRCRQSWSEW